MAFTYCTNCGEKIDDSVERCPHCNHLKGVDRAYGYTSEDFGKKDSTERQNGQNTGAQGGNPWENGQNGGQSGNPWENDRSGNSYTDGQNQNGRSGGAQGGNPWENGQNKNPWENNGNPYGQSGPWQNPYGSPYNNGPGYGGYQPWQPRERRKISVGLLVFSIINILLGTCCAGSIFGIIGLVFAITARDAATEAEEIRRKKISLAINIIAVVLTVAFMISFAIGFINGGGIEAFMPQ